MKIHLRLACLLYFDSHTIRAVLQIKYQGALSTTHRINPNIILTMPGIETKRNSKSKSTDQTSITEYIEFYRLAFAGGGGAGPMGTTGLLIIHCLGCTFLWNLQPTGSVLSFIIQHRTASARVGTASPHGSVFTGVFYGMRCLTLSMLSDISYLRCDLQ